jgi:uncharacterized membrane protein
MTQEILDPLITREQDQSLRSVGHISYAIHAIVAVAAVLPGVQTSILLLIVAFGIDMFKRAEAQNTWHASHFSWRIRSVLWAGGLYLITIPLWLVFFFPGWIAWTVISLWFLYRVIRGWLALSKGQGMIIK